MGVVSRKWNSAKNVYDDTSVLDFYSNNSVNVRSKLAVGGFVSSSSAKFTVKGSSDSAVSSQFRGTIQVNQFDQISRAHAFLSTSQGSAMVGGNLRLSNLTGEASNVGKTATVWITCDNQYKLYHNDALIGEGTDWQNPQSHTFIVTGNDRIGVEAINTSGPYGLCYVIIVDGKVVFETNKTDIKASAGPFSTGWNVSNNLFNFGGSIPVDGTFQVIKQSLIAAVPGGDIGSAEVIWMPDGTEINRTYFFQGRFQEVTDSSYQKGTNLRGSAAIEFIEGSNSTGEIKFLRANDTNDANYTVTESGRFDENGRFGIGVSNPTQALDVSGNIKSSGTMFLTNDGYPQLVLSDANQQTRRFGIWKENTNDQLAIGPQTTAGSGTPAIRVYRNATVDILKGGKVNTVLNDDKALVNKAWVKNAISAGGLVNIGGSDVFQATGDIYYAKGDKKQIQSPLGNVIPDVGAGNHSHGMRFAGILTSTHGSDGGGLFLDVTDNNNDEHALSIYNTAQAVNKEVFHIRSATGDTYSAGDIHARGGIASETKLAIGDKDEYWTVEKNNTDLRIVYRRGGTTQTALTLNSLGQQLIEREPTAAKHAATKKYVDNRLNSVITTLPKFQGISGDSAVNSSYNKNSEFSFDIADLSGLSSANAARVYAVDATIHTFGGGVNFSKNFIETSFKYPDGEFKIVQSSHGVNDDDDCGSSASIQLPVSGSKVVFKANHDGRATPGSGINGVCKVVINGFWYYDVSSTPQSGGISFAALDEFDIDVLILQASLSTDSGSIIHKNLDTRLTEDVTHTMLKTNYTRPTTAAQWEAFNAELSSNQYGIVFTTIVPFWSSSYQANQFANNTVDDIPQSTYNEIRDFVTRGGSLFILSDHVVVTRQSKGLEKMIIELGGTTTPTNLTLDNMNVPNFIDKTNFPRHFVSEPSAEAVELGIVNSAGGTIKVTSGSRIIDNLTNGIPLMDSGVGQNGQPASGIHGWFGKLGHLNNGVRGNIIWIGDHNLQGDIGNRIIHPLLTFIEKTN